jgi:nucleoside-diphosphate-sugar epimerase
VHVDDVAAATAAIIRRGPQGTNVFNLSTPTPVTWNDYCSQFSAALGTSGIRRISPSRLAAECHLVGPPLRALELLCNHFPALGWTPPPAIRPWLLALCRHDIYMSVERIHAQLGFRFMPLSDGLRATARAITGIGQGQRQ